MLRSVAKAAAIVLSLALSLSCTPEPTFRTWQEEVKLSDGRVITVTQKKRCEGAYTGGNYARCIAREAWLTVSMPESSARPIVWHENLSPRIFNVYNGTLYVVGVPPTGREFEMYGKPRPPYIGFLFDGRQWKRIAFTQIPTAIYNFNLLLGAFPPDEISFLSLTRKDALNSDPTIGNAFKHIDPAYQSNFD